MKTPLQTHIERHLETAAANPGKWQTFRTTHHLKIDLLVQGKSTYLKISRSSLLLNP